MKAITIIKKIQAENGCSIARAELLTKAMHREGILPSSAAIRFRPLFGDFDIVNADFETNGVQYSVPTSLSDLEKTATTKI